MSELPSVSVVMPTYNRRSLLQRVVEPLLADPAASEVVVVVDGCRDGSYEWLVERAGGDRRLRPLWIENQGENGARRAGIERARGEVVLLLDDDVAASPGLASGHARRHAGRSGLVVVGYMPPPARAERRPGDFTTRLYAREYESVCAGYERAPERILHGLWAGNMSLRREDCLRVMVDGAAPALAYHADRELGLRCLKAGLRGEFDRSLRAAHLHTRTLDGFARDARAQGAGAATVHALHGDVLGPLPAAAFDHGLPAPAAAWLRLCRRPRVAAASSRVLRALTPAAGRARLRSAEEAAGRLLRRIEQQRGALEAAASAPAPRTRGTAVRSASPEAAA
jgi:GT2 family glycosyltransferase